MLIDPYEENWQEQLREWTVMAHEGAGQYLLIDGAFLPGLFREVRLAIGSSDVTLLFKTLPGCSDVVRDYSPFVVKISEASLPRLKHILDRCSGFPMLSYLETPDTLAALTLRLSSWCIIYADGQRFNFRFADVRRLKKIFEVLTPLQQGELTGNVSHWAYIDRSGRWERLLITAPTAHIPSEPPKLDESQFSQLVRDSEADELLASLSSQNRFPDRAPSRLHAVVRQALSMAEEAGLSSMERDKWCEQCLVDTASLNHEDLRMRLSSWRANE